VSLANVVDICGNTGLSAYKLERFLERIDRYWAPLNMSAAEVRDREQAWKPGRPHSATGWRFITDYLKHAAGPLSLREVVKLTRGENGAMLLQQHGCPSGNFAVARYGNATAVADDTKNLAKMLPVLGFDAAKPATFIWHTLMRVVLKQSFDLTNNDMTDLSSNRGSSCIQ
jgi:hypothetical protein